MQLIKERISHQLLPDKGERRGWRTTATLSACAIGTALAAGPARAQAPIITDGTMGARVELNGPAMQIPHTLGTQTGKNLFHSFQRFNIPTATSATFTGPGGIDNVVSRVTGGEASTIDGTFRSTIPGANVWFANPAGVTFGPNASLNVPASFHASTANEIRFPDGARFSADLGATSTLSVAPPEAFGFLSSNPAPLKVEKSHLSTVTGATLSLAAGGIDITDGTLQTPSGTINLASVSGPAEVKNDGTVSGNNHGAIRLTDGALVDASGDGAGVVRIRGGEVTSTGSSVLASNTGSVAGAGGIDISADRISLQAESVVAADALNEGSAAPINVRTGDLSIQNSSIHTLSHAAGKAGNIQIDASNQMTLDHSGFVLASSVSSDPRGAAGDIKVNAGYLLIRDQSQITSLTTGPAPAGNINVSARTLLVDSTLATGEQPPGNVLTTGIVSSAESGSGGNAGTVSVSANDLTLSGHYARIDSSTSGSGKAGNIHIDAPNQMTLDHSGLVAASSLSSGAGGDITVNAGYLLIRDQSQISNLTRGPAPAGNINVSARTLLVDSALGISTSARSTSPDGKKTIPGKAGNITIRADEIRLTNRASIKSETEGPNDSGIITLIVPGTLTVEGGSEIATTTYAAGKAGKIQIDAPNQMILENGSVYANSLSLDPRGAGGDITVRAGYLLIKGQSQINSLTRGPADAGNITVTAGTLLIDALVAGQEVPAGFSSSARSTSPDGKKTIPGRAGNITIRADEIRLANGALIRSETEGPGDAGIITLIVPGTLTVEGGSNISSSTSGSGNAGTVIVRANNLTLNDAKIRVSTSGSGKGGNIQIDAPNQMTLDNLSGIFANALSPDHPAAAAGDITVNAGYLLIKGQSQINSFTKGPADAGNIKVTAGTLLIDSAAAPPDFVTGISSTAESGSSGNAGTVRIQANNLTLNGPFDTSLGIFGRTNIDSSTLSSGNAGVVTIEANNLTLEGDARIGSSTLGSSGNAGVVSVNANNLTLTGPGARINSATSGSGNAGVVSVNANNLTLTGPGARIGSATLGSSGNAGVVSVNANNLTLTGQNAVIGSESLGSGSGAAGEIILTGVSKLFMSDGAEITTRSGSAGGGNIEISGAGMIVLRDGSRIGVDVAEGEARAGDITIGSRFLVLLDRSAVSATADAGSGGNIHVASDFLFRSQDSEITARAGPAGIAGNVVLTSPEADVTGGLTQLPGKLMDAAGQMQVRCAARGSVEGSSFTIAGLEAQSPALEGYLAGTYAAGADETAATGDSIMIASGGPSSAGWIIACGEAR